MMISYETLQSYSSDELRELFNAANTELFELQKEDDKKGIDYWSELSYSCREILKSRNNG
jgi:hypothetical protein